MKTKFNPIELRYSMQGWMGDFSSVEAVQRADDAELEAIAGSYEAIADRMKQCIDFAKQRDEARIFIPEEDWLKVIEPVIERYKKQYGEEWGRNAKAWKSYLQEWARERAKFPLTLFDSKVAVLQRVTTRGIQLCPFEPCKLTWNDDITIASRVNGRALTINRGTEHMVREHGFLEKGNEYGISAKEFYKAFM